MSEVMEKTKPFLGAKVEWTSQAGGHTKTKQGEVIAVIPALADVRNFYPAGRKLSNPGDPRNHESYLIHVKGHARSLYWPRVSRLKVIED